jgi:DNA-binding FadR family transcriptional regulator
LLVSIRLTNKDPRDNEKSVPFHREVFDAILNRDSEKAESLTATLLKDAQDKLESINI